MKLTRKQLRKLIKEAIVVDPYGSARVISDDPAEINRFISKKLSRIYVKYLWR